ncbi:MAG: DRTGG domain-containing protein [Bacteroidota bacterium]|nr:DRTGG domain-containing protein [Bacteroidota bacterium]
MKLKELTKKLSLIIRCGENTLDTEITGGYVSDLLSDVINNAQKGDVWVTMQVHVNIVAVAVLKEVAAIIIVQGREPNEDTLKKAKEENIPILVSKLPAFQLVGKLYESGIGKT